ncbi:phage late control D family protein [Albidovulum sp.]|uniref:phage late control D family protein n=1 Tax=Albidovulum sp. TaxID=1872424 RepID=UPI0039B93880
MTPDFRIVAGGEDVSGNFRDRLLGLTVTDEDGGKADRIEIEVDDRDGRVAFPDMDTLLDVSLGFRQPFGGSALSYMGRYAVDGVAGAGPAQRMRITATAADMKGDIRAPKTRAWEDKTLKDIVAKIAAEAKLKPVVGQSVGSAHWPYIAQTVESDLHFLTRIAATLDATAKPAGGALVVQRRGEGKTAAGDAVTPVAIDAGRIASWTWKVDGRAEYRQVEAEWSDTPAGQRRKVTRGQGKPVQRLRHLYASAEEATRACDGELSRAGRASLSISVDLAGFEPGLFAGGSVSLSGLRSELEGEWHIARVTHELGGGGLITKFDGKRARG